ncbi:MAG: D-alanyl-D-alanine carboxypeptidase family protein [Pseudomonadota bacterium]
MRTACLLLAAIALQFSSWAQIPLIQTDASHAVILDHDTGTVLFEKNGADAMIPASMTKMMTAHVVFDRLARGEISLSDRFVTSERAWSEGGWGSGGSTMGLAIGDDPTVEELLRGVIVLSGNDACIVLAEGISGSEEAFATEMTALAQQIGLTSASFQNSTGLDAEGHRISAIDLAKLAQLQIEQFPDYYPFYNERSYEWRGISQPNRNPLLGRIDGVDGLKTGHLAVSGYGLTASADQNGERRIIVINGMDSEARRAQEAERLMRLAFSAFETKTIGPENGELAELDVWLGVDRTVPIGLREPLEVSGHKRAFEDATSEIVFEGPLNAPIKAGDEVGELVITLSGREPVRAPVYATRDVAKLGFVGRMAEGLNRLMTSGNT